MNPQAAEHIKDLGEIVKEQLTLLQSDDVSEEKLIALSEQGQKLTNKIVKSIGILKAEEKNPLDILKEIVAIAGYHNSDAADTLKEVLPQIEKIKATLPQDSCPTLASIQHAAKAALK